MARTKHGTLSASSVATQSLTRPSGTRAVGVVRVINRGADDIYVSVDGSTPTVAGDDTWVVGAGAARLVEAGDASGTVTVKLISAGTPAYSVELPTLVGEGW